MAKILRLETRKKLMERAAIFSDNPIKKPEEDLLSRSNVAISQVNEISDLDASEGYVVVIMGPWGSGKTSSINLIRLGLENEPKMPVIDFNSWMFSGTQQLVDIFRRACCTITLQRR